MKSKTIDKKVLSTLSGLFLLWSLQTGGKVQAEPVWTETYHDEINVSGQRQFAHPRSDAYERQIIRGNVQADIFSPATTYGLWSGAYNPPGSINGVPHSAYGQPGELIVEGNVDLKLRSTLSSSTTIGVWSGNHEDTFTHLKGNVNVAVEGTKAYGLLAGSDYRNNSLPGGILVVEGQSNINVKSYGAVANGYEATGALACDLGTLNLNNTAWINVTADGNNGAGLVSVLGGTLTTKDVYITVDAGSVTQNYPDIWASDPRMHAAPAAIGISSHGNWFGSTPQGDNIATVAGNAFINVTGDKALGLQAMYQGDINIQENLDIYAIGKQSELMANKSDRIRKLVNNSGGETVKTQAIALYAHHNGNIEVQGAVNIHQLQGEEKIAAYAQEGSSIIAKGGFYAIGDNVSFAPTDVHSLYATGDNTLIDIQGGSDIYNKLHGTVTAENAAQINLELKNADSFLYGQAEARGSGQINLTLADKAYWTNLFDSKVTNLHVNGSGVVNMLENAYNTSRYQTITTDSYTGQNGIFMMDTDLQSTDLHDQSTWDQHSDQFVVTNNVTGTDGYGLLQIADASLSDGWSFDENKDRYKLLLVTDFSTDANFGTLNIDVGGLYYYEPILETDYDSDANRWYLVNFNKTDRTTPGTEVPVAATPFAGWRWRNTNDTLLKRLGELRYTDNDSDGGWTRISRSKHTGGNGFNFTNHTTTIQVGFDKRKEKEKSIWRHGIALSYSEIDSTYNYGKGENQDISLAVYGTKHSNKGHYLDLIVKGSKLKTKYETYGKEKDYGNGSNWAASISAEYGRKKLLDKKQTWYVEPQAQLNYGYLWGNDYTSARGIRVEQGNVQSLVGRLGIVLSKESVTKKGHPYRFYAKASFLREFLGKDKFFLRDKMGDSLHISNKFEGSWYEVGIGANIKINDSSHLYFDLEKSFGGKVKMPYRIEAGFRWQF